MPSRALFAALSLSMIAACGDPPTQDPRGYTKNTLEVVRTPFVKGQPVSEMDRLGDPIRPDTALVVLPDTTSGGN